MKTLVRWHTKQKNPIVAPSVAVLGNFDGVHLGHQALFNRAIKISKEKKIIPTVITFYPAPAKILSNQAVPVLTSWGQRLKLFQYFGMQQTLLIRFTKDFAKLSSQQFLQDIYLAGVKDLVIGPYACIGKGREGTPEKIKEFFTSLGGTVHIVDSIDQKVDEQRISSSTIREQLAKGDLPAVKESIGRPYSIVGRVRKGKQLGHTMGFPTANLCAIHETLPPQGVYVTDVLYKNKTYRSMTNIGTRPTVSTENKVCVETHIFNFSDNIYGEKLQLSFLSKLRDEKKFASIEELKQQLMCDAKIASRN